MPAKGDGITKRKDGRYMARYTVHTPGGPKRKLIYGKKYKEVEKKLNEARGDAARGITYDAGAQTVGEYLARWLSDSVRDTVRQRTYERYESIVRVHLDPSIGRLKLKALTPAHVRALYRERLDAGLAPRSVLHIHRILSKALKQAHDDGLVPRNAAGTVRPPRPRREEIRPLNREQVRILFKAAREDRLEALYVVAVTAGLRRGELQGLKWDDVDLSGVTGTLQVRRTLSEPRGGYIFEAPKSGKGRSVRLTRKATASLREHRKRQLEGGCKRPGSGVITGSSSPLVSARPCWVATSTALSKPRSSAPGCPASASTIVATRALRSYSGRASTRSTSRSFWVTPT